MRMKNNRSAILFVMCCLLAACGKSKFEPAATLFRDTTTITSQSLSGFSFVELAEIDAPFETNGFPDFQVNTAVDTANRVTGVTLSSINPNGGARFAFSLAEESEFASNPEEFFYSINTLDPLQLELRETATEIRPNQLWVVITQDGRYAKLLVLENDVVQDPAGDYGSFKFLWIFQSDGSARF